MVECKKCGIDEKKVVEFRQWVTLGVVWIFSLLASFVIGWSLGDIILAGWGLI